MRFPNRDVMRNLDGVLEMILQKCTSDTHPPLAPPSKGGELEVSR
jgi:very-short-patch-repair endonuclease